MIPSFRSDDEVDFDYAELFNSKIEEFKENELNYSSNELYKDFRYAINIIIVKLLLFNN